MEDRSHTSWFLRVVPCVLTALALACASLVGDREHYVGLASDRFT